MSTMKTAGMLFEQNHGKTITESYSAESEIVFSCGNVVTDCTHRRGFQADIETSR